MNADANKAKMAATIGYGATIVSDGVDPTNREQIARDLATRDELALVHPFDDWNVIAGQGTRRRLSCSRRYPVSTPS